MTTNGGATTAARAISAEPADIVKTFLLAMDSGDLETAIPLLAEDVEYTNVSLPAMHGRHRVERALRGFLRLGAGFRVHFHSIAADGATVLTERTDAIVSGRVEQRFWVYGRFEVRDGQIAVWRDSFDWADLMIGLVRGIAGAFVPALNRRWPGESS